MNSLSSVEIEAQPGMVFWVRDQMDLKGNGETHVINESGVLNLSRLSNIMELKVKGFWDADYGMITPIKPPGKS